MVNHHMLQNCNANCCVSLNRFVWLSAPLLYMMYIAAALSGCHADHSSTSMSHTTCTC